MPATLKAEGSLAPLRASGELSLKAEGLDLGTWDPYLDSALDLRVSSGKLGMDGRLRFAFEGRKSDGLAYQGGASVQGLTELLQRATPLRVVDGMLINTQTGEITDDPHQRPSS